MAGQEKVIDPVHIRLLDPDSQPEIERSARWMRATLVEVEGKETGTALYTMDWLCQRVRWHTNPELSLAAVLLAEGADGEALGHTIVRRETTDDGEPYGLVSTTYVEPSARRAGIGTRLLNAGEQWFLRHSLMRSATWTSATNTALIQLYRDNGYNRADSAVHAITGTAMVKLEKRLTGEEFRPVMRGAGNRVRGHHGV